MEHAPRSKKMMIGIWNIYIDRPTGVDCGHNGLFVVIVLLQRKNERVFLPVTQRSRQGTFKVTSAFRGLGQSKSIRRIEDRIAQQKINGAMVLRCALGSFDFYTRPPRLRVQS